MGEEQATVELLACPVDEAAFLALAAAIDFPTEHLDLLRQALTHRSCVENLEAAEAVCRDNERLEFLGDSVLGLLASEYLYHHFAGCAEGVLTRMRARLVSKPTLAAAAERLRLGELALMAPSEVAGGGRARPKTLSDAFEAVLAAVYLTRGLDRAREFLQAQLLDHVDPEEAWDHKSRFQELMQAKRRTTPTYRIREQIGPAHDRQFVAEVMVKGKVYGRGQGRSKKDAQQAAAEAALAAVDSVGRRRRSAARLDEE